MGKGTLRRCWFSVLALSNSVVDPAAYRPGDRMTGIQANETGCGHRVQPDRLDRAVAPRRRCRRVAPGLSPPVL